jgi:RNA polymerase sigma-70 factor (ECF subfamily)
MVRLCEDFSVGDTHAVLDYVEFYEREFDQVVRSVRHVVGSAAEDIAQEAFIAAFDQWDDVRHLDLPVAWVNKVAHRIAWRSAQRERARAEIERHGSSAQVPPARDLDLIAALADLRDRHQAAVWLHHVQDRPVAEVAELLGCSVGATKVLLMRARQHLARRLRAVDGRWVSEQNWTRTAIARRITASSRVEYVEPILDDDLGGIGGRWVLSVDGGSYRLERDDGLRLDDGRLDLRGTTASIDPFGTPGRASFRLMLDADRLRIDRVVTTLPPTRGVPDGVWLDLFLESGPLRYAGSTCL